MPPFVRPQKPLPESRLALVTTGGVHLPEQPRFDIDDPAGDCSYREIPTDAEVLTWTHAYHRPDEGSDLDAVFPLWTLREPRRRRARSGPSTTATSPLWAPSTTRVRCREETAPEVAGKLVEDGVDAVLLTPS